MEHFAFVGVPTLYLNVICYLEMAPIYNQLPTVYGSGLFCTGVKVCQGRL